MKTYKRNQIQTKQKRLKLTNPPKYKEASKENRVK